MDKNKTIIVILTIVIVVVAASSVTLWLFYPRNQAIAANTATAPLQYVQGNGLSPAPETSAPLAPSTTPSPAASPMATVGSSIVNQQVLIVDGSTPDYRVGPDGKLLRNNPAESASPSPSATPASGLIVSGGTTNTATPATSKPSVATPRPTGARATKLPSPAPAVAPARHGNEFWIQVVSSPNKDRVEQIRKELGSLGFNGRISGFNKSGTDFYRLRYGPYFEKAEAGKFLDWVKVIKGLEASYVVEEKAVAAKPAAKKK